MKSFITMFAALVLTATLFAAPPSSRLNIINAENRSIRVEIDGNRYNEVGNNLSLGNLNVGYHNVRIYQIRRGFFSSDRLLYSSSLFIKPDRQINLIINRGGDVAVNEQSARWDNNRNSDNRYPNDRDRRDRDGRSDNGRDRNDRRDYGYNRY